MGRVQQADRCNGSGSSVLRIRAGLDLKLTCLAAIGFVNATYGTNAKSGVLVVLTTGTPGFVFVSSSKAGMDVE
jgi:hypothetical protein